MQKTNKLLKSEFDVLVLCLGLGECNQVQGRLVLDSAAGAWSEVYKVTGQGERNR